MTDRLSPLDNAFLQVEDAENRMQLAGMLLFDGEAPSITQFRDAVAERLLGLPRFKERVSGSMGGLLRPKWEDDPAFDLEYHVSHVALPAPGGHDDVAAHIDRLTASPLDRHRPLWEMELVEGLEDGFGVSLKVHHCMVDGLSIIDIFTALLAPDSDLPGPPDRPASKPAKAQAQRRTSLPAPIAGVLGLRAMLGQAPSSPLNTGQAGPTRRTAYVTVPLDDIHAIRHVYGTTVNNAVLAVVSGALRRYLDRHDSPVEKMHAFVPVNARRDDARGSLGNQIAMTYPELPVGESDPDLRIRKVIAAVGRTAETGQAVMTASLMRTLALAPAPIAAALNRAMQFRSGMFNVTITNVPGPPVPVHFLGRQLNLIIGSTPLTRQHAVTIAVLTYNGTLTFMVTSDPRRVPDGSSIAADLRDELADLRDHVAHAEVEPNASKSKGAKRG